MTDVNHVVEVGRLTRDIGERDFDYTPNGKARLNISLAVNRSRKNADGTWGDEVFYFDVTVWGKQAENIRQFLRKGKQVAVDGYLRQDRWEKDGQKQSRVLIVADNVELLGGSGASDGQCQGGTAKSGAPRFTPRPQQEAAVDQQYPVDDDGFPEDIPF